MTILVMDCSEIILQNSDSVDWSGSLSNNKGQEAVVALPDYGCQSRCEGNGRRLTWTKDALMYVHSSGDWEERMTLFMSSVTKINGRELGLVTDGSRFLQGVMNSKRFLVIFTANEPTHVVFGSSITAFSLCKVIVMVVVVRVRQTASTREEGISHQTRPAHHRTQVQSAVPAAACSDQSDDATRLGKGED